MNDFNYDIQNFIIIYTFFFISNDKKNFYIYNFYIILSNYI